MLFSLLFAFLMLPVSLLLCVLWLITKRIIFVQILGRIWFLHFGLITISIIAGLLLSPTVLQKKDYYGQYIIDRQYFAGVQADWQYEHFRFEIKRNDSIYFHVTDKERIVKTYKGKVKTTHNYQSQRLIVVMDEPTHHVMSENPTTYRSAWSFRLVFHSPLYNNMYFKKGKWKPLKD